MITQTYDPTVYELVPKNVECFVRVGEDGIPIDGPLPTDLPGVVTHSGKPYGFAVEANDGHITFFKDEPKAFRSPPFDKIMTVHSLFTHADSAEVSALRQRVAELSVELDRVKENWCNSDVSLRTKLRESQLAQQDGVQPKHHPADMVTDGGRNMFFEGLFPNESERERARLRWANDMRAGFESHFSQSWFDKDWFRESGIWTAAWRAALAAQPTPEAIVKAALEAAGLFIDDCDEAGENVSFSTMSASIRALDHATIIQAAKGTL